MDEFCSGFGWSTGSAPDAVKSMWRHVTVLQELLAVASVRFECQTNDLEFVSIEERNGRILVSDRGDAMRFFSVPDANTGKPSGTRVIAFEVAKEICERVGAELVLVEDMFAHITIDSRLISDPREAVRIVADAADRVAAFAHNGWHLT